MDAKLFRVTTQPNYYPSVSNWTAKQQSMGHYFPKRDGYLGPAPDSRFPGWAGPMEDGRMGTDYRTHCYKNIPAGSQYASHQWIQHNTDSIIEITRNRLSRETGANSGFECGVVPPPEKTADGQHMLIAKQSWIVQHHPRQFLVLLSFGNLWAYGLHIRQIF